MTHIISREYGFSFIHIPKNGGSTIRVGLESLDDTNRVFAPKSVDHEQLGRVWLGHLPLWAIEQHYPSLYSSIRDSWAFAVTRDPFQRFASALAERGRKFLDLDMGMLTNAQLHSEASKVIEVLRDSQGVLPPEFCHFTRQTEYVKDNSGSKLVKTYPIENYSDVLDDIKLHTGVVIGGGKVNSTKIIRFGGLGRLAKKTWKIAKPVIGEDIGDLVRRNLKEYITKDLNKNKFNFVYEDPTYSFIKYYYELDFELHRDSMGGSEKLE